MPNNPVPNAADAQYFDHFAVHNRFYGAQVGLSSEVQYGAFFLDAAGKVGLGVAEQDAQVAGGTVLRSAAGATTAFDGGVLAPLGAAADATSGRFAAAVEGSVHAGYTFTPHLRLRVGWEFLYLSQVGSPAGLIGAVDSRQVPQLTGSAPSGAAARPALRPQEGGYWTDGLTCGVEFRY